MIYNFRKYFDRKIMTQKCMYGLISLFVLLSMSFMTMAQEDAVRCYSCGYMLTSDGNKTDIPERYEHIPFCAEDTIDTSTNENTKTIGIVRYLV